MPSHGKSPVKYNRLTKQCVCVLRFSGLDMQSQRSHGIPTAVSISRAETMSRGERGVLSHAESAENAEFWSGPTACSYQRHAPRPLPHTLHRLPWIQNFDNAGNPVDGYGKDFHSRFSRCVQCFYPNNKGKAAILLRPLCSQDATDTGWLCRSSRRCCHNDGKIRGQDWLWLAKIRFPEHIPLHCLSGSPADAECRAKLFQAINSFHFEPGTRNRH